MSTTAKNPISAEHVLFGEITVKTRKATRRLTKSERETLIQTLAIKAARKYPMSET